MGGFWQAVLEFIQRVLLNGFHPGWTWRF